MAVVHPEGMLFGDGASLVRSVERVDAAGNDAPVPASHALDGSSYRNQAVSVVPGHASAVSRVTA